MRKKISIICLALFCLLFLSSLYIHITIHEFDCISVKENIDFISSDFFKGRLPGTLENEEIAFYIKNDFQNTELKPFISDYLQHFNALCPCKTEGTPYLCVMDANNNIVKKYVYGKDFKEDMLNFRNNKILFSKENTEIYQQNYIKVSDDNQTFLFYVPTNNELNFRSSFIANAPFDMYIAINDKTFKEIKNHLKNNYTLNCYIPYKTEEKELCNVMGYIPGTNTNLSPIIVSAHFDHVGTDLNGNIYNGALDNASGVSFVMEISKYIHSLGKPYRSILFVAFNAEEFGCIGSKEFVDKYKPLIENSKVYNFDMIGTNNSVPLCIMGGEKDTHETPFIHSVSSTCSKEHIQFNYIFSDSSDHKSFRKENIEAITFCDNDLSRIHTPEDKTEFIDTKSIQRCYNAASREIVKSAFIFSPIIIYYKQIMIISLCGIAIILILLKVCKKKK